MTQPLPRRLATTGALSLVGKGAGFLVPVATAAWFGVGRETDAFFLSYAVVFFGVGIWGQGIEAACVSQVARWLREPRVDVDREVAWARRRAVASALAGYGALLLLYGLAVRPTVGAAAGITGWASFILLGPMLVAAAANGVLAASLAAHGRFNVAALSQGLRAVGVIACAALLRDAMGVASLALGYSLGECARWAALERCWRAARRAAAPRAPVAEDAAVRDDLRRGALAAVWPQLVALALVSAGPLFERWVCGRMPAGAVTQIDYGMRLFAIPSTLFDSSVAAVLLSYWAHQHHRGLGAAMAGSVGRAAAAALGCATLIAAAAIWQRELVVSLLLGRGAFSEGDVAAVAAVFGILMLGFPIGMAALVLERGLMAVQRTRALLVIAGAKVATRVLVATLAGALFGVRGVAMAQPVSSVVDLCLLVIFWRAIRAGHGGRRTVGEAAVPSRAGGTTPAEGVPLPAGSSA